MLTISIRLSQLLVKKTQVEAMPHNPGIWLICSVTASCFGTNNSAYVARNMETDM